MKNIVFLIFSLLLFSCDNFQHRVKNSIEEKKPPIAEKFEIVSVETGWYQEQRPQIKIKLKNKSGKPINEAITVKYRFIENDEVFDEGFKFLHNYSDINWENGLSKTQTYRSSYGYSYGGHLHKVRVKVCFDDDSLIWEGDIKQRIIY